MERSTRGLGKQATRLRTGVVGCGLVAQVMHLPYLRELPDRFDVVALCDLSSQALAAGSRMFPAARRHHDWNDLVAEDLDAVLVLTPGSHAPIALAAAASGRHVFVEKPIGLSVDEAVDVVAVASRSGVCLMVGYMKRYDPAYERLAVEMTFERVTLVRITTLESPLAPYVGHHPLVPSTDVDPGLLADLAADDAERVTAAIGTQDAIVRRAYREILLDSMVHEINGVRGLLGEPTELRFSHVWGGPTGVTAVMAFGDAEAVFAWADLPGIARYEQDWSFYAPDERATLVFPSPFLRNAPTTLVLQGGDTGGPAAWRAEHVAGYDEAFKRELVEFHSAIVERREPRTPGADAIRDVALCQSLVRSWLESRPILHPSDPEQHATRAVH